MKVKFLVPEIDKERWAEKLKKEINLYKLKSRNLSNIGSASISEQNINNLKNGSIPTIDYFLTICRFFYLPPDIFLHANPKWIECEINDVSNFSILGQINNTYYISPFRKNIKELLCEPNPGFFSNCHLCGTEYYSSKHVIGDSNNLYQIPYLNSEKTSEKIFSLLKKYNLSNKQIQILLGLSPQSVTNRKRNEIKQGWIIKDIYKLSWILNVPFEELLVIDYRDETRKALFDPIDFLEHYVPELISDDTNENTVQSK